MILNLFFLGTEVFDRKKPKIDNPKDRVINVKPVIPKKIEKEGIIDCDNTSGSKS